MNITELKVNEILKFEDIEDDKLKRNFIKNKIDINGRFTLKQVGSEIELLDAEGKSLILSKKEFQKIKVCVMKADSQEDGTTDSISNMEIEVNYPNYSLPKHKKLLHPENEQKVISDDKNLELLLHDPEKNILSDNDDSAIDYLEESKPQSIEEKQIDKNTAEDQENESKLEDVDISDFYPQEKYRDTEVISNLDENETVATCHNITSDVKEQVESIVIEKIIEHSNLNDVGQEVVRKKDSNHKPVVAFSVFVALLSLVLSLFALKDYLIPMELELMKYQDTIAWGSEFKPEEYVKKASNGEVILPGIDTHKLGTFSLSYIIKNSLNTKTVNLQIDIVDQDEPQIELMKAEVFNDQFYQGCAAYIKKVVDNVDGDITDKLICTDGESEAIYEVLDSSGNKAVAYMKLNGIPACDINAAWDGKNCVCNTGYSGDGFNCSYIKPKQSINNQGQLSEPSVNIPGDSSDNAVAPQQPSGSESYSESFDSGWIYEDVSGGETEVIHIIE